MIDRDTNAGLSGQLELGDVMGTGNGEEHMGNGNPGPAEGYDEAGNLMNYEAMGDGEGEESGSPSGPSGHLPTAVGRLQGDGGATGNRAELEASSVRLAAIATEITTIEQQARGVVMSAALEIGKRLIEAKGLVPEGRWLEWLSVNIDYSDRRAQDLMRLYENYGRGTLPEAISRLDYSKAVALLAAPEEHREALAERAVDEGLSVRGLQEEIKRLKREKGDQQLVIDGLRRENDSVREDGEATREREEKLEEELKTAKRVIADAAEKVSLAQAKATAAEASANELRRLHSDAEDRAAASAQRASDAVNRANQTAKELNEARARIAQLEAETGAEEPKTVTVEVVPESVRRELNELKLMLAEERAKTAAGAVTSAAPPVGKAEGPTATEKFRWFYANQMKPAFATALDLLREVAQEDGHAATMFATALNNGCKQLMAQLGE